MSKKLKYKIISCSSQETQYPVSSLLFSGQNGGWQTKRFCTYPQEVTFQFYGPIKIDKIQIISDNRKIPSQVDILHFLPFASNGRQSQDKFKKYGYLMFNKNENSQIKQQKSIMVDIKCLYLRFLIHKPHHTKENFFSQIGIQQISIFGSDNNNFAPVEKIPRQISDFTRGLSSTNQIQDDPYVYEKLSYLNSLKEQAVAQEDFEEANFLKSMIQQVKKLGEELNKLQMQKKQAIQQQNYEKANNLKKSVEKHKQQIDALISFEQNDQVTEEQPQQRNENNHLNDFQDNEFVDPEMSEMIQKSTLNKQSPANSRIVNNSRVKLNRSMVKKDNITKNVNQSYDQRVIPTLAGGGKVKTEQQQPDDREQDKKIQLHPEQIDGKYIQFSLIMQEHLSEDTVKSFFSQHWQLKVQALTTILQEIKKKPNAASSFIKCLIVVVKNSLSETNFQVALNSLQVLEQLLKTNARGNLLSRTNQLSNDLDAISKQIARRLSDNNNKIKQQAQKCFREMIKSSLYSPQLCSVALCKNKQKNVTKLSTKQIMTRLIEMQKIIEAHGNSNQIIQIALDFGIQQSKNPVSDVRNQAVNLLIVCRNKNGQEVEKRLLEQKNILQMIETAENKSSKIDKSKKKK